MRTTSPAFNILAMSAFGGSGSNERLLIKSGGGDKTRFPSLLTHGARASSSFNSHPNMDGGNLFAESEGEKLNARHCCCHRAAVDDDD